MKNHLKRIFAPKTWSLARREKTFVARPNCGPHSLSRGLALGVLIRDHLSFAATMVEAKKLLQIQTVLVDGKRRKDHHYCVGLFDVLSFPHITKYYRLLLDKKGRLALKEITSQEASVKICKVVGKKVITSGKIQYCLHDGRTLSTQKNLHVGDSVLFDFTSLSAVENFPLEKNACVYLVDGKYAGSVGFLQEIKHKEVICKVEDNMVETAKDYLFVVGAKQSRITLQ